MFVDLDKRGQLTMADITPEEARTLMNALLSAIQDTEEMLFDDWGDEKFRFVYTGELKRLKSMVARIEFFFPAPGRKKPETVGEAVFP